MDDLAFTWDAAKAEINRRKHRVTFEEASTVFYDDNALLAYDEKHSTHEDRFVLMGLSSALRILIVVHAESRRGGGVRIISARRATARERRAYMERP